VKEPSKTVRVNITLVEQELRDIDQRARAHGLSRSAFLVQSGLKRSQKPEGSVAANISQLVAMRAAIVDA
jgi:hypothetical protein